MAVIAIAIRIRAKTQSLFGLSVYAISSPLWPYGGMVMPGTIVGMISRSISCTHGTIQNMTRMTAMQSTTSKIRYFFSELMSTPFVGFDRARGLKTRAFLVRP